MTEELIEAERTTINGIDAIRATSRSEGDLSLHGLFLIPGRLHTFRSKARPTDHDEIEDEFAAIIGSFTCKER